MNYTKTRTSKENTADHGDRQTPFWNRNIVVGLQLPDVPWVVAHDDDESDDFTSDHTEVCEAANAAAPAIHTLEYKGVRCQKEVE